jgi:hypothetical protein
VGNTSAVVAPVEGMVVAASGPVQVQLYPHAKFCDPRAMHSVVLPQATSLRLAPIPPPTQVVPESEVPAVTPWEEL